MIPVLKQSRPSNWYFDLCSLKYIPFTLKYGFLFLLEVNNLTRLFATSASSKQLANIRGLENEPKQPDVKTTIPGPKSKELVSELSKVHVK